MVKQSIRTIAVRFLAVTLLVMGATAGRAQNFPVQAFATLIPPYSLKLSDYAAPEGNRLRINLLLKDALQPTLDVRLRFTIEGNGVKLTTKPGYFPQSITLLSNTLFELGYSELSEYFLPINLVADGMSMSALTTTGMLPEGLYKFKVEALEASRNVVVSNTALAIGWLMLNDPPQWLSPRPGQKLTAGMPQGIQLSWTRSGMSSPNAALSTQYEVTIVEMTQPGMDANIAIVALPPIYQEISPMENLFYGPDKPELLPGNYYAVRIRAFDTRGLDLYRNGGFSPVTTFRYGEPCFAPAFLQSDKISEQTADLSWNTPPLATGYFVRYRENGADLSDWYDDQAAQASFSLKSLKPDCTYEYQVQSMCGSLPSEYSVSATLKTKKLANLNQTCAEQVATANMPTNMEPLPLLRAGETFFAGVFPVEVTTVKATGGTFTGTGTVYLPVVGVGLRCTFTGIGINTEYQLISGEVVTVRNKNATIFGDLGTPGQPIKDTLTLTNPIDTIITNPNGDVIIVSGGDSTHIPLADQPVLIYPPSGGTGATTGTGTTGGSAGGGTTTGGGGGEPLIVECGTVKPYVPGANGPGTDLPTVQFHRAALSQLGYDSLVYEPLRARYNIATIHEQDVAIPFKALAQGQPDNLELEFKPARTSITVDSLTLELKAGTVSKPVKLASGRYSVMVTGTAEGETPLLVSYPTRDAQGKTTQEYAGAATMVIYRPKPMKLVVVPLSGTNNASIPNEGTLKTELDAIYGQAVCSWTVDVVDPFTHTLPATGMEYGSSELASSYTEGMNGLIDAYSVDHPSAGDDTYYLFIVPMFSDGTIGGYMPRARSYGFIAQASANARTIAHELGHGAFNLRHTFPLLPRATTDNLMDYNNGSFLLKPQWDLIHNPEMTTGLLDDVSDGASIAVGKSLCIRPENVGKFKSSLFFSPDNKVVDIKDGIPIAFFASDETDEKLRGCLVLFKLNGILYTTFSDGVNFLGYAPKEIGSSITKVVFDRNKIDVSSSETTNVQKVNGNSNDCHIAILVDGTEVASFDQTKCTGCLNGEWGSNSSILIDLSRKIDQNTKESIINNLVKFGEKGLKAKICLTDYETPQDSIAYIKNLVENNPDNEIILWIHFERDRTEVKDFRVGKNAISVNGQNYSELVRRFFEFSSNLGVRDYLKLNISLLDILSYWINSAEIPAKYWNPNEKDYNPIIFEMYDACNFDVATMGLELPKGTFDSKKVQIAFVCGFYNGAITTVAAVPDAFSLLIKLMINDDHVRDSLAKMLGKMQLYCGQKYPEVYIPVGGINSFGYSLCLWDALEKHFSEGDIYQKTNKWGRATFDIVTIAFSVAKVGNAAKIAEFMGKFDAFSILLNGTFKVVKPIARLGGKTFKCGKQLIELTLEKGRKATFRFVDNSGKALGEEAQKAIKWVDAVDDAGNPIQVGLYGEAASVSGKVGLVKNSDGTLFELDENHYLAELAENADGQLALVRKLAKGADAVKDVISKRVIKTISKYDKNLGQVVEYPKYNNVALGKNSGGALKQFGDEVGANVWTAETDNVFTSMYDLPDSWSFERSITSVLNETVGVNQGKILFDVTGVNIQKAVTGGLVHDPLSGLITEFELQMVMRNKSWYDNVIFHEGSKILNNEEKVSKGIKYIGQ